MSELGVTLLGAFLMLSQPIFLDFFRYLKKIFLISSVSGSSPAGARGGLSSPGSGAAAAAIVVVVVVVVGVMVKTAMFTSEAGSAIRRCCC